MKTKKTPAKKQPPVAGDPWSLVLRNHDRFVHLGPFGDISQPPKISDVEIVVCFADIRGFTAYCHALQQRSLDNRIQNFLKQYFKIYSYAVLQELWELEPDDSEQSLSVDDAAVHDIIIPVTYKNLGDGVMLVWEIPSTASNVVQGRSCHHIFSIAVSIYHRFGKYFQNLDALEIDSFSELVKELRIGFGVARGHAWKLDFGHHLKFDYAGSIVNLAARLQSQARPEGIVCQYEFSQALFDRLCSEGKGKVKDAAELKGLGTQKVVVFDKSHLKNLWNK